MEEYLKIFLYPFPHINLIILERKGFMLNTFYKKIHDNLLLKKQALLLLDFI